MSEIVKTAWAGVKINTDFICIETYSGYGSCRADYKGAMHLLSPDVPDQALGEALLDALLKSRFVLPEPRKDVWIHPEATFDMSLYDYELNNQRYAEWISNLMRLYGYKTKRALFRDMKNCNVESRCGEVTIRPSCHEKLEAWSGRGISESDYVVIPSSSSPAEVGAALRLAFSRCT